MSNQKKIQEVIDSFEESYGENKSNVVQLRPVAPGVPAEVEKILEENAKLVVADLRSALNRMTEMEHLLLCKASEYCSTDQFKKVFDNLKDSLESDDKVENINYNWAQAYIAIHTLKGLDK